jgi:DNA-binding response OmpR family regulator
MDKNERTSESNTDILIVEDSPTQAAQIKYLLESYQFSVVVTQNGMEAMEWLSRNSPLLVISDILMPVMNGFELCDKIKSNEYLKDIPVILLTALSDPDEVIEGLLCGADSFITKPYNKKFLLYNIEKIILERKSAESQGNEEGIGINYGGRKRMIRTPPQQVVKLLLSIYQGAIFKNNELIQSRTELRHLNEKLEELVEDRTKAMSNDKAKNLVLIAELEKLLDERNAQIAAMNKDN